VEITKIDDFTRYKFISAIKHSPDGKHACFVVSQAELEENKYLSNLWIFDLATERYNQLTSFDSERNFLWVDNENIIFPSARDIKDKEKKDAGEEFTQYYRINIHGGEAIRYFRIPRNVSSIEQVDKDTFLFTSQYDLNRRELDTLEGEDKEKELKTRKENKDYEVLEEIPFWGNGDGFTSRKRNRLYIYNAASDKLEALTDEYTNVEQFSLNKKKTKVAINSFSFRDKRELTGDILIYDILSKKMSKLDDRMELRRGYVTFLSEDTLIFTGTEMKVYGLNENEKFYVADIKTMKTTCITPKLDLALTNSVGSDCRFGGTTLKQVEGERLYFVTTEGDSSFLNRIDSKGNLEKLASGNGSVDGISVKDGNILLISMKSNKLQELFVLEDSSERRITDFNEWVQLERKISEPERISVETQPGVTIDGWVIRPVDFDENKKYPAILDIHGGPKTVYGTVFFHEMQYWASEGYAVFFCNPRGSDGKGNDFADIRGKYGTIDYEDIMKFTDEVLRRCNFIDRERVGVTGGSYGGFMTNWIIGHTDRFKAAASQRSISNWISFFATTDIGYFFGEDQILATPWANQEKLWEHSPLKYAHRVKTPMLVLHSEEDYRCWLTEGLQMFTALKYHGVEARMCMFRGENHELSRSGKPKHRLRRLQEITEWFNKYLK
jgi:dipeptidyl aminopeptidase/acylaminoacyl peptidase